MAVLTDIKDLIISRSPELESDGSHGIMKEKEEEEEEEGVDIEGNVGIDFTEDEGKQVELLLIKMKLILEIYYPQFGIPYKKQKMILEYCVIERIGREGGRVFTCTFLSCWCVHASRVSTLPLYQE